jgi:hypothetical protein
LRLASGRPAVAYDQFSGIVDVDAQGVLEVLHHRIEALLE